MHRRSVANGGSGTIRLQRDPTAQRFRPDMTADPSSAVPAAREFTMLGITYGLYALGLVMFWPAAIGLIFAYVKRGDVEPTFLASHYSWLIRTFWWWVVGFAAAIGCLVAWVLPSAIEMGRVAQSTDVVRVPWELLGGAIVGGLAIALVWFWVVYRLIRGTLRLADGRAVP
jgi:uncharacterized membrane protein